MDLNSFLRNANYLPWLIPVGPELLTYLDQAKRLEFIKQ